MRFSTISIAAAISVFLISRVEAVYNCNPASCVHPACVCASPNPPKGLDPKSVPQFFTLTFDDGINTESRAIAKQFMDGLKNPNGCPIQATWFVQTLYSDFSLVQ